MWADKKRLDSMHESSTGAQPNKNKVQDVFCYVQRLIKHKDTYSVPLKAKTVSRRGRGKVRPVPPAHHIGE